MKTRKTIIIVLICCAVISCIAAVAAISSSLIIKKDKNITVDVTPAPISESAKETPALSDATVSESTPEATPEETAEPTETPAPTPTATPTEKVTIPTVDASGIDPNKPIVALSFDDGPAFRRSGSDKSSTERILATLEKYNVHATFFVVGSMNADMLSTELEKGHEIGNHTMTHQTNFKNSSIEQVIKEINDLDNIVKEKTGKETYLVRPPWGAYNQDVLDNVKRPMILWSVDTLDWKSKDKDAVMSEVKKQVFDGAIILMHDIHVSTADAVEIVLPWLIEQGYQVTSVSEMFAARNVPLEPGHVYSKCTPSMMNGN